MVNGAASTQTAWPQDTEYRARDAVEASPGVDVVNSLPVHMSPFLLLSSPKPNGAAVGVKLSFPRDKMAWARPNGLPRRRGPPACRHRDAKTGTNMPTSAGLCLKKAPRASRRRAPTRQAVDESVGAPPPRLRSSPPALVLHPFAPGVASLGARPRLRSIMAVALPLEKVSGVRLSRMRTDGGHGSVRPPRSYEKRPHDGWARRCPDGLP